MALTFEIRPEGHTQKDGRRWVVEIHSDGQGEVARFEYKSLDSIDRNAIATARSARLAVDLADREAREATLADRAPSLRFQTGAQFLGRLRELYRNGEAEELARIARWIRNRVQAGDVTAAQLRNAFGLTQAQWDALKAKMDVLAANLDGVEQAKGE